MKRKDREWMYNRRDVKNILRDEFIKGVDDFVSFAEQHPKNNDGAKIRCPCFRCRNLKYLDVPDVKVHLYKKGFTPNYYVWLSHGERVTRGSTSSHTHPNPYREMVVDALGHNDNQSFPEEAASAAKEPNAEAKMFFEEKDFTWKPEIDKDVRMGFYGKVQRRLNDMHDDIVNRRQSRPGWLTENVYKQMKANAQDPSFLKRSARAKANRRCGNIDSPAPASHCQGSVCTTQRAKRLAKKKGKMPNAAKLYLDTHLKSQEGKESQPISKKAREVMDNYHNNLEESQESGSQKEPNQVFFDTVGGFHKGEVHGFGKDGASFFSEKSSMRSVGSSSSSYSPSLAAQISQLSQRLEDLEERKRIREEESRRQLEAQQKQLEAQQKQLEYMVQMKTALEAFMKKFGGTSPFPGPGGPPDDPTDGSSASGAFLVS